MDVVELLEVIIESQEFKEELETISSYGINIKQERPIQYLIARIINEKGLNFALEYNTLNPFTRKNSKYDLYVEGKKVELKFFFEEDFDNFERSNNNFLNKRGIINKKEKKDPFYIDIIYKECDIFLLIVQSRDLFNIGTIPTDTICVYKKTLGRLKENGHGYNYQGYRENIEKLFQVIFKERRPIKKGKKFPFEFLFERKNTTKFESIYRFYILQFS